MAVVVIAIANSRRDDSEMLLNSKIPRAKAGSVSRRPKRKIGAASN